MTVWKIMLLSSCAVALTIAPAAAIQVDWPSYNRTLTSERFSPLKSIDHTNAANLAEICRFDTGETTTIQSGLIQVNGALFVATERDTYSIDPDTCKLNWRAHEDLPSDYLASQRGVAVANGRVYRGSRQGSVYAYDAKTGVRLWATEIADKAKGESVPAAPIAWDGKVFIGIAGGDNRGVKGRTYALDGATGRIVWEAYLVPKTPGDRERGPQGEVNAPASSWKNDPRVQVTGGGSWSSYSLDPATGLLYIPGGNPAPTFAKHLRSGANLYAGSLLVLDAATGAYRSHYTPDRNEIIAYDVSSAPAIFTIRDGTQALALTPKDGFLYAFDRQTGKRLYRVQMAEQMKRTTGSATPVSRFCPGGQGGSQWNGPAFDPDRDAIVSGQANWCSTVRIDPDAKTMAAPTAKPWFGSVDGIGKQDSPSLWSGWVTSVDAQSGRQQWRFLAPNPILSGVTPTAGGITLLGDVGGNFFVLNSSNGKPLFRADLRGSIAGGVITYDTGAGQKIAVVSGMTSPIWPTPKATAQIVILGLK